MKKFIFAFAAIASTVWFVGCSKGSDGSNGAYGASCPAGSSWNGTYCVNANGGIVNPPGPAAAVNYYDYKYFFDMNNPYSPYNGYPGNLTITNTGAYQAFLKEALRVCDVASYSWGGANCSTWTQGSMSIAFTVDSSLVPKISIAAVPGSNWYSLNLGWFSGGVTLNPLQLFTGTTYNLINNSKGFEIRSNGSSWNAGGLKLIQIQVPVGTLNDQSFTYDIYYPFNGVATKMATGRFNRSN